MVSKSGKRKKIFFLLTFWSGKLQTHHKSRESQRAKPVRTTSFNDYGRAAKPAPSPPLPTFLARGYSELNPRQVSFHMHALPHSEEVNASETSVSQA